MKPLKKPRILLIGAGKFGEKHLNTLLELEKKGLLKLAGVVVKSDTSAQKLQGRGFPTYTEITDDLLRTVDAVDIVTPPETHHGLIKRCLPHVHVLVEKPMTATAAEAKEIERFAFSLDHKLMVGHIYRFNPAVMALKGILESTKERPVSIEGTLTNPTENDGGDRDVELEFLHLFDIADYLFEKPVVAKFVQEKGRSKAVSLKYKGGLNAVFNMGWIGTERVRTLRLEFKSQIITCDLGKNSLAIYKNGIAIETVSHDKALSPLEAELRTFLDVIRDKDVAYPHAKTGRAIVDIATRTSGHGTKKKRIAIIGAGIFGTNCAIELAKTHDVTIFEKNDSILSEASFINQYRHHWGYHYPRSQSTVDDIRGSVDDFEKLYNNSIIREFPTYYSVAKEGSKVTADEYIAFCDRNSLPYTIEYPDASYLDREKTSTCLKTFEPIYDFKTLKKTVLSLLRKSGAKLKLNAEIRGGVIHEDGTKTLVIKDARGTRKEDFDYVINVTYARHNQFCKWFGFHVKPIRLDLVETLWMRLKLPKISFAVMDGPFTNMVPTGKKNIFTLVHIKESMLRRFVPKDGLVPKDIFTKKKSNAKKIIAKSIEWLPIVKEAEYLESHYVLRGVNAYREHDDARPSDITDHGFGCWSVLGGKIINSVTLAKKLSRSL